jgi:hypothetical protein
MRFSANKRGRFCCAPIPAVAILAISTLLVLSITRVPTASPADGQRLSFQESALLISNHKGSSASGNPFPPCEEGLGTGVKFVATPKMAVEMAEREGKLLFLLHISGNFEDADFT